MKKIPCRLCPSCGKYSSLNVTQCPCGADLKTVPGAAVEHSSIPLDKYGRIDTDLTFYVRKCPVCSTEHFFTESTGSVRSCRNCHKSQISFQPTIAYVEEAEKPKAPESPVAPVVRNGWGEVDESEDAGDTGGAAFGQMLEKIQSVTGSAASQDDAQDESSPWSALLAGKGLDPNMSGIREVRLSTPPRDVTSTDSRADSQGTSAGNASLLTATAVRYGQLSFTLRSDSPELPYLLGRSANHADFLRQDPRVGNEHCYLAYRNGSWMVIEKRAINGTAVNGAFLAEGGSEILQDGDLLTLGHHPDSMAFRISIPSGR